MGLISSKVPLTNGALRLGAKYRKLNSVNIRESNPLSRSADWIKTLGEAKVFVTVDANKLYWHVKLKEDYKAIQPSILAIGYTNSLVFLLTEKNARHIFARHIYYTIFFQVEPCPFIF